MREREDFVELVFRNRNRDLYYKRCFRKLLNEEYFLIFFPCFPSENIFHK